MKPASYVRQLGILISGAFFSLAPLWASHIQQVGGRNLFATPDSMVLLGVTLLVSLLGVYLLPDSLVKLRVPPGRPCVSGGSPVSRGTFGGSMGYKLWAIGTLSALVYALYLVNQYILHSFLSSADEHSCYFLAECLRKGKLFVEMPQHADFFKVVHVGMRDGKWFSVYPPGWPLIWAMGLNFNIVDWLNPVLSSIAVLFFYLSGVRLFGRRSAVGGLILMCLNPFFMLTAASYFSHATCLLIISIFLYAFLRWQEGYQVGKDPVGWASLCALAVGYGLMTRYLTMAAVAGPFLLYHYLPIFFEWKGWGDCPFNFSRKTVPHIGMKHPQLRKSDWIALGIISAFMILILWQSYRVTGKLFKAPNKYDKSWERLGFRRDYTPLDGFFYLIARVFYLMDWFAPALVALYLFLILGGLAPFSSQGGQALFPSEHEPVPAKKVPDPLKQLFRLTMVFIAFAYFFYYSWGGNQWGPRYLWEGMPFLSIAVADWIVCRWHAGSLRTRKFLLTFVIMSLATSGMIFAKQAEYVEESSRQRRALYDLAEKTIQGPGIVFIHGFLGNRLVLAEEDAVRNSPFLDGRILYAHDLADRNKELVSAYPKYACYRGSYDRGLQKPLLKRFV